MAAFGNVQLFQTKLLQGKCINRTSCGSLLINQNCGSLLRHKKAFFVRSLESIRTEGCTSHFRQQAEGNESGQINALEFASTSSQHGALGDSLVVCLAETASFRQFFPSLLLFAGMVRCLGSLLALAQKNLLCSRMARSVGPMLRQRRGLIQGAFMLPMLPPGSWDALVTNYVFMSGFWGWFFAQSAKIFTKRIKKGVWDVTALFDSGGMPSSHSALCTAVTTAVAMDPALGVGSSLFAISLCFSLIVMYDAAGVRRHAGKQAEVLNIMLQDLLQGHPISENKLKEVLGHTPLQVSVGGSLGVLVGYFYPTVAKYLAAC